MIRTVGDGPSGPVVETWNTEPVERRTRDVGDVTEFRAGAVDSRRPVNLFPAVPEMRRDAVVCLVLSVLFLLLPALLLVQSGGSLLGDVNPFSILAGGGSGGSGGYGGLDDGSGLSGSSGGSGLPDTDGGDGYPTTSQQTDGLYPDYTYPPTDTDEYPLYGATTSAPEFPLLPTDEVTPSASPFAGAPDSGATTTSSEITPVAGDPSSVVQAYVAAINAHDYQTAWTLGGENLSESYQSFVSGFSNTAQDLLVIESVDGDVVTAQLTADNVDLTTQVFAGTYTVTGTVITHFNIKEIE